MNNTHRDVPGACRAVLTTDDDVRIEAAHTPCTCPDLPDGEARAEAPHSRAAVVVAHGFSGSLGRPAVRRAADAFARCAGVVTFSFRGHGGSGGHSTVGDREVHDLAAAVRWARSLGYTHITTVGFSMGGSVVVRHGALYRAEGEGTYRDRGDAECPSDGAKHRGRTEPGTASVREVAGAPAAHSPHSDAVVAVSAPARWYYRGTAPMRRLHWAIQRPVGRLVVRYGLRTRIHPEDWAPVPLSPVEAAPRLAPTPLLVVHGDADSYFPLDHPLSLAAAAGPEASELWIEPGFGHAENAADGELLDRIAAWSRARCRDTAAARHDGTRNADS